MSKSAIPHLREQEKVNAYFQSQSAYWKDIYTDGGVQSEVYRKRQAAVLDWIDGLALAPGSRVLEVGCGAGFMAIALAQRGFHVHAIDSIEAMLELARRHATESGTSDLLCVEIGDVYSLAFEDNSFDLVVAIGVIAWLERPDLAMQEMARVTRPGGHVILTAHNWIGLNSLLDPWLNPILVPLKQRVKNMLERVRLRRRLPSMAFHSRHFIDETLAKSELVKTRGKTLGFGPLSLFRRTILPESLGIALHRRLQYLADRDVPGFRSTGMSYLVLARKSAPGSSSNRRASRTPFPMPYKHYNGGFIDERH